MRKPISPTTRSRRRLAWLGIIALLGVLCGLPNNPVRAQVDPEMERKATALLKKFSKEPSIRQLHKAGLEYALVNQDRIGGLVSRARHSGWLPEFRVRYNRNTDDDRTTSFPTLNSPILTTQATDDDHRLEFRATWRLDDLIFNRNEITVYRELRRLVELRTDILKEITKLYFERRRLQLDLMVRRPSNLLAYLRQRLRLQELSADLDALTGGNFSRLLREAGKDPYK
ncbi:MAG: hypothetical protein H6728_17705 [Myxococcales bacterium]|nr:hypothetical protein [Myxococcales bacterium]MCB9644911.1 hypothetical protein [Myxococcales bacterium]